MSRVVTGDTSSSDTARDIEVGSLLSCSKLAYAIVQGSICPSLGFNAYYPKDKSLALFPVLYKS